MKKLLFTFDQETLDLEIDFKKIKNGAKIKKKKIHLNTTRFLKNVW